MGRACLALTPTARPAGDTSHGAFCYINVNDAVASGCDPYVDISQDALDLGLAGWDYCGARALSPAPRLLHG